MNILVTGGAGFVGSVLTPALLRAGHRVTVVDTMWFGNFLKDHPALRVVAADVRDTDQLPLTGIDAIIHLANIANDPCVELQPALSWEVNVLATMQLAEAAKRAGVRHFIFASSGSVYGVKNEERVTEDLPLVPISVYNKTKMVAERVLLSYRDSMTVHCLRPATVCGYSPRMRLDVSVNMLTMQALKNRRITVFGGQQVRPNIHIQDMVAAYFHVLENPVPSGCYNVGFENLTLLEIADRVRQYVPADVIITPSNDPRSYRLTSDKFIATGFRPRYSVADGIKEVVEAVISGQLDDHDRCYNVRWMNQVLSS